MLSTRLALLPSLLAACAASSLAPAARVSAADLAAEPTMAPARPPRPLDDDGVFYVETEDPGHPRVRYLDGQLALDGSCAIKLGNKLSRRVPPAYVNGQPLGFC